MAGKKGGRILEQNIDDDAIAKLRERFDVLKERVKLSDVACQFGSGSLIANPNFLLVLVSTLVVTVMLLVYVLWTTVQQKFAVISARKKKDDEVTTEIKNQIDKVLEEIHGVHQYVKEIYIFFHERRKTSNSQLLRTPAETASMIDTINRDDSVTNSSIREDRIVESYEINQKLPSKLKSGDTGNKSLLLEQLNSWCSKPSSMPQI